MKRWRLPFLYITAFAVVVLLSCVATRWGMTKGALPIYEQQVAAAHRMLAAYDVLWAACPGELKASTSDPNHTGLIGPELGDLLTTMGSLEAKRTSTNPDFAALLVRLFWELGLKPGDKIALGCSGSFPALILASLVAAEVTELEPLLMVSLGASSYGATSSEWTWLDMETVLLEQGLIHHMAAVVSLGGEGDIGASLPQEGREAGLSACRRNRITPLVEKTSRGQLERKLQYLKDFQPKVFVNVGGNQVHVGGEGYLLPPGVIRNPGRLPVAELGLVGWCLANGVPVIHLLHIREIALQYGLALDPIPFPVPGKSLVYFKISIRWSMMIPCLLVVSSFWLLGMHLRFKSALKL